MAAHTYGQAINLLSIILIPFVAVKHWGEVAYGVWLTITAITQLFSLIDMGWTQAIQNQLCLKTNRSKIEARIIIWFVMKNFLKKWISGIVLISVIGLYLWEHGDIIGFNRENEEIVLAFLSLSMSASLQPIINIYSAVWRYIGGNEKGIIITNSGRLLEILIIILMAYWGFSIDCVALTILIIKILIILSILYHIDNILKRECIFKACKKTKIDRNELRFMKKAASGFNLYMISQQLFLNGPVIIISMILGPVTAAVFSASRTLSRLPVLPISMFLLSINQGLTEYAAHQKYEKIRKTTIKMITINVIAWDYDKK